MIHAQCKRPKALKGRGSAKFHCGGGTYLSSGSSEQSPKHQVDVISGADMDQPASRGAGEITFEVIGDGPTVIDQLKINR